MGDPVSYGAHQSNSEAGQLLATYWPRVMADIRTKPFLQKTGKKDEPIQELPLARIKKIMKQDGDVKMISAEAPILFAKAAEIFISELSLRAWIHTEDNKRRTLQRNDIAMAITKYDQFDFLIDIVPRDELKPAKRQEEVVRQPPNVMAPEQVQYYFHLSQLQSNAAAAAGTTNSSATPVQATANTPQITHLPPGAHVIQQNGQFIIATPQQLSGLQSTGATPAQTANGAVQPQIVQLAQPPPQAAQQNTSTTPASAEGTQSAVQQSTSNVVQQQSTELSTSQAQSNTTQVQCFI
eukprot:TCONS_00046293-protein